jgi:hypothetical protein
MNEVLVSVEFGMLLRDRLIPDHVSLDTAKRWLAQGVTSGSAGALVQRFLRRGTDGYLRWTDWEPVVL